MLLCRERRAARVSAHLATPGRDRSHRSPHRRGRGRHRPCCLQGLGEGSCLPPGDSSSDAPEARLESWTRRVNAAPGGQRGRPPALAIPPADTFSTAGICLPISDIRSSMADGWSGRVCPRWSLCCPGRRGAQLYAVHCSALPSPRTPSANWSLLGGTAARST